jgi:hypothetical protein
MEIDLALIVRAVLVSIGIALVITGHVLRKDQ